MPPQRITCLEKLTFKSITRWLILSHAAKSSAAFSSLSCIRRVEISAWMRFISLTRPFSALHSGHFSAPLNSFNWASSADIWAPRVASDADRALSSAGTDLLPAGLHAGPLESHCDPLSKIREAGGVRNESAGHTFLEFQPQSWRYLMSATTWTRTSPQILSVADQKLASPRKPAEEGKALSCHMISCC